SLPTDSATPISGPTAAAHIGLSRRLKLKKPSFFFQAEDGIRDGHVTGVQTCALPISGGSGCSLASSNTAPGKRAAATASANNCRSEERRVGKECRSRWWLVHSKNIGSSVVMRPL